MSDESIDLGALAANIHADQSNSITELAAALSKAQGAIRPAVKDKENPHFKSRYSDLNAVWEAARKPLSDNGLAVLQRVRITQDGVSITTQLIHSSGQWLKDTAVWPTLQRTPQGIGSSLSYGKRYALAALLGIASGDDDDDGNAASTTVGWFVPQQSRRDMASPKARKAYDAATAAPGAVTSTPPALRQRINALWEKAKASGTTADAYKARCAMVLGKPAPSNTWTEDDVAALEVAAQGDETFPDGGR